RESLVAEVAIDLVHALVSARDQALQIELRRDTQIHVEIERIVMRHERTCRRAACDRLHHRRLNFEEIESVEEITQIPDYPGSCAKDVAARFVDDQIDITLAIAHLDIGESVPLVRQRPQRL